eukprot:1340858-Rhodomonas_salina.1
MFCRPVFLRQVRVTAYLWSCHTMSGTDIDFRATRCLENHSCLQYFCSPWCIATLSWAATCQKQPAAMRGITRVQQAAPAVPKWHRWSLHRTSSAKKLSNSCERERNRLRTARFVLLPEDLVGRPCGSQPQPRWSRFFSRDLTTTGVAVRRRLYHALTEVLSTAHDLCGEQKRGKGTEKQAAGSASSRECLKPARLQQGTIMVMMHREGQLAMAVRAMPLDAVDSTAVSH